MTRQAVFGWILAAALVGAMAHPSAASTAFAVYSERTLYGMNFDYPPDEIRFSIEEHEAGTVFVGSSWMDDRHVRTVGMNERGLFASAQMVSPPRATVGAPAENEVYVWDAFHDALRECGSVDEVLAWIGERRVVQCESLQLHNLYADPTGDAMVVESGAAGNVMTQIDGSFVVMTNFHNGDFRGLSLDDVAGDGAERYRVAYRYIEENLEAFDVDHAMEALRRVSMARGDYKTRYSLVLDPEALEVYVALERDYEHVWKVSLAARTIETYQGFNEHRAFPLDATGISGATLQAHAAALPQPSAASQRQLEPPWVLAALVAAGVLGVALWLVLRR